MQAVERHNYLDQLYTKPLTWTWEVSGHNGDRSEIYSCRDGEVKVMVAHDSGAYGWASNTLATVSSNGQQLIHINGREAGRLFDAIERLRARSGDNSGVFSGSLDGRFPAGLDTDSKLERAWSCLKHGSTDYRSALFLEEVWVAIKELPITSWKIETAEGTPTANELERQVTRYSTGFNGLSIELENIASITVGSVPPGLFTDNNHDTSSISHRMTLNVRNNYGELLFTDEGIRPSNMIAALGDLHMKEKSSHGPANAQGL